MFIPLVTQAFPMEQVSHDIWGLNGKRDETISRMDSLSVQNLTITFRDLKIGWNEFFNFFWKQGSSESFRGQLNKKFA